jgi:hypothetical protein
MQLYIFSTSDGFYSAEESLTKKLQPFRYQPPVSVMGLNVFKPLDEMKYLTGSFNGMFLWDVKTGGVYDFFTGKPYVTPEGMQNPIGANMAAGLVEAGKNAWWFDYNVGALPLSDKPFPEMPEEILKASPMSLWNVSLEIHTGRIFEHLLGPFYILYVPLAGICLMIVLISGVVVWWKVYRKLGDAIFNRLILNGKCNSPISSEQWEPFPSKERFLMLLLFSEINRRMQFADPDGKRDFKSRYLLLSTFFSYCCTSAM